MILRIFLDLKFKSADKGQLISKCLFGVIVSTKIPTNLYLSEDFAPSLQKKVELKKR